MTTKHEKKRRDNIRLTVIAVLLFAFAGVAGFVHKITTPTVLSNQELRNNGAIVFEKPRIFGDVSLTDHNGEPFDNERLKGKWSILLFGFTYCPDICPTALAELSKMLKAPTEAEVARYQSLAKKLDTLSDQERDEFRYLKQWIDVPPLTDQERADLQVVMISVDPERDTQEALSKYVPYFNESFTGVTGNPHFIRKMAAELNVAYNRVELDNGDYTVDHSAQLVLINPYGHYHGFFRHPQDPTEMRLTWRSIRQSFGG